MTNETWETRQSIILDILTSETIHNQSELLARLAAHGLSVTQSSISRDLRELRVAKVDGRYVPADTLQVPAPLEPESARVLGAVVDVRAAGPNLLVLLTSPGLASATAVAIDRQRWPEVVGTVAGDDTIFVATSGRSDQAKLEGRLAHLGIGAQR